MENNHVYGWLASVRHPLTKKLDLVAKYDEFYPVSQGFVSAGGLERMDLVRKTAHTALLYQLDPATRFRLWYMKGLTPYDPSTATGFFRDRLGFITGEVQVTY